MNRYIVQPMPSPDPRFVVIDTETNKQMGIYPDRDAAVAQALHYNQHKGTAVGAPITPDKKDWDPFKDSQ